MLDIFSISPIDGRYAKKVNELRKVTSEYGLIYYRVLVEIEWLKHLSQEEDLKEVKNFSKDAINFLDNIILNFNENDALKVKEIEKTTNHDVKAVEYYLKDKISMNNELKKYVEFIHFACTSEDINNLSYSLMLKKSLEILKKDFDEILLSIKSLSLKYKNIPYLSRTHGQAASPSTFGKEFYNVYKRLERQLNFLEKTEFLGKINGATGNFNAHIISYPELDWVKISKTFVENKLKLSYNLFTTQIEPHDYIAEFFYNLCRINTILIDFNRDIWSYISFNYFKQKTIKGEIGSSTMPHKVNPIDFENSEGNLGFANAIMEHLAHKLPISRMQRDLTDSTVLRNIGVGIAHSIVSYKSLLKGLSKLEINEDKVRKDLDDNLEILGEAIQTVMRRFNIKNPYEKLKDLTRGKKINTDELKIFIENLEIPDNFKDNLKELTPQNYIGLANKLF